MVISRYISRDSSYWMYSSTSDKGVFCITSKTKVQRNAL